MIRCRWLSVPLLVAILPASAAELRDIAVVYEEGVYSVDSEVWFDAPQDSVYAVFADWDLSTEFSSAIVEARSIGPDAQGRHGYYVRNRGCILFFCKSVVRTGTVEMTPDIKLTASADPEQSDFDISDEQWLFHSEDGRTVVHYSLKMKPGFWVPPVIGPYLIKRKLRDDGGDALDRIEQIARRRVASGD